MTGERADWRPMECAPRDGTVIEGRYGDDQCETRWLKERQCMMAGYAGGYGYFGPGWAMADDCLIMDEPDAWRPSPSPHREG